MKLDRARKELEDDILLLIRLYETETALNASAVVRALNHSFEAHCFETIRRTLTFSIIQIIVRMLDRVGPKSKDRASFHLVERLIATQEGELAEQHRLALCKFRDALAAASVFEKDMRDFRIAHIAHNLIIDPQPALRYITIDQMYLCIKDCFVNMEKCFDSHWQLDEIEAIDRRFAKRFAATLRRGMQFDDARTLACRLSTKRQIAEIEKQRGGCL